MARLSEGGAVVSGPSLPEVGKTYIYKDTDVVVIGVNRRGRGYSVAIEYEAQDGPDDESRLAIAHVGLIDFNKHSAASGMREC